MVIGGSESVETKIPQQSSALADTAIWAKKQTLIGWLLLRSSVEGYFFQLLLNLLLPLKIGKVRKLLGILFKLLNSTASCEWAERTLKSIESIFNGTFLV